MSTNRTDRHTDRRTDETQRISTAALVIVSSSSCEFVLLPAATVILVLAELTSHTHTVYNCFHDCDDCEQLSALFACLRRTCDTLPLSLDITQTCVIITGFLAVVCRKANTATNRKKRSWPCCYYCRCRWVDITMEQLFHSTAANVGLFVNYKRPTNGLNRMRLRLDAPVLQKRCAVLFMTLFCDIFTYK